MYLDVLHRPRRILTAVAALALAAGGGSFAGGDKAAPSGIRWEGFQQSTLRQAGRLGRPAMVYLTSAWCMECRRVEEEVFSDPEIQRKIRDDFVAIRVDRDRRPDLYARYERGGLPSVAFVLPSGNSMFFQEGDRFVRAGGSKLTVDKLNTYLDFVTRQFHSSADAMEAMVRNWLDEAEKARNTASAPLTPDMAGVAANLILRLQDPVNGGFRGLPQVVRGEAVQAALEHFVITGDEEYRAFAARTLDGMARGSVRDPLDGLFYRMTTKPGWQGPTPERLLRTQSDLLLTYTLGYRVLGGDAYRHVVDDLVDGLLEQFYDRNLGVFLASEIPASAGAARWSWRDFRKAVPRKELEAARLHFGVEPSRDGQELRIALSADEVAERLGKPAETVRTWLEDARARLGRARGSHWRTEKLVVSGWSAETARALLHAWVLTGREDALEAAELTLRFIEGQMTTLPDGVFHAIEIDPPKLIPAVLLTDQVATARANLMAYQVTGERDYLDAGRRRLDLVLGRFSDPDWGGLVDRRPQWGDMGEEATRDRRIEENAEAAVALFEMAALVPGDPIWKEARTLLEAFADEFPSYGPLAIPMSIALHHSFRFPVQIVVVSTGDEASEAEARALRRAALGALPLWKTVLPMVTGRDDEALRRFGILHQEGAAAYRVEGNTHHGPYRTAEELVAALAELSDNEGAP